MRFSRDPNQKKIIAIIPARSGSKGLKNKNIKFLGGHPLLAWSIELCKKIKLIDYFLVSTDSKKYAKIALKYKSPIPFLRPKKISKKFSTDYALINHALSELSRIKINPEIIVYIRPTTPLRNPKQINEAIKAFMRNKYKMHSLRSVHEMSETAYKSYEISNKKLLKPILKKIKFLDKVNLPRQNFKKTYVANGIVDIFSSYFIKKNKMLYGSKVMPFITSPTTEVDNINDFKYLEYQVKNFKNFIK
tara:strand:+ start:27 stop:767 length:741 start_codon:yes stop_codon:yes gene_type:complete